MNREHCLIFVNLVSSVVRILFYIVVLLLPHLEKFLLTQQKCIGACAGGCPSYVWGSNKKCLLHCLSELQHSVYQLYICISSLTDSLL